MTKNQGSNWDVVGLILRSAIQHDPLPPSTPWWGVLLARIVTLIAAIALLALITR
jgi:hypothetical protein